MEYFRGLEYVSIHIISLPFLDISHSSHSILNLPSYVMLYLEAT